MPKKKQIPLKKRILANRMIVATTGLLLGGVLILFAGWLNGGNAGLLLMGFGSAFLFISAVLYWFTTTTVK
jgi:hypothetical protein